MTGNGPEPDLQSAQAYQAIRSGILEGEFAPGAKLSEASVANWLDMGKAPVRTALAKLCQEGLLEVRPRSGFRVAEVTPDDIIQCFQIRLVLEPMAVRLATGRVGPDEARELIRLSQFEQTHPDAGAHAVLEADRQFHAMIAELSGNKRLKSILCGLLEQLQRPFYLWLRRGYAINDEFQGGSLELAQAIVSGDANRAAELAHEHIVHGQMTVLEAPDWRS